jgi:hypothetical protein
MRINPVLVAVAVLLISSPLYAADCSTSFDQSCLPQGDSHGTAEKSEQPSTERRARLNTEACREAVAEKRRTLLVQNQLDTELALNELPNRANRGEFDLPSYLTKGDTYLPSGAMIQLHNSARNAAYQGEESRIREQGLWNQKMIEAKSAEAMDSCLVKE